MANVTGGNNIASSAQLNPDVVTAAAIATDAVDTAEIKSGAVKTDEINDGAIVNADINAAAAIAITKLESKTQGSLLIYGASGVPTELAAGSSGQVLTSGGAGANPAWAALTAPVVNTISTCFETAARFTSAILGSATSSANTFGTTGLRVYKHYTYGINAIYTTWQLTGIASTLYSGSPMFTARVTFDVTSNSVGSWYIGLGEPTVATTGHTFTVGHCGFKVVRTGGVNTLYATQADGSTENASSALTTLVAGDDFDLYVRVNSTTSVDYFWRKNGGAISAATNLTANMPAGTSQKAQFSISCNNADDQALSMIISGASYVK